MFIQPEKNLILGITQPLQDWVDVWKQKSFILLFSIPNGEYVHLFHHLENAKARIYKTLGIEDAIDGVEPWNYIDYLQNTAYPAQAFTLA